ncbi:MAG: hypothetical protein ACI85E_001115 [Marinomonas primoryensis]|jgi:hypothetical protein
MFVFNVEIVCLMFLVTTLIHFHLQALAILFSYIWHSPQIAGSYPHAETRELVRTFFSCISALKPKAIPSEDRACILNQD